MITAAEAKAQTQEKINSGMTEELVEIESQIKKAVLEGKFSFSVEGNLFPGTKKRLEDAGYKVTKGCQYNEYFYTVSWL